MKFAHWSVMSLACLALVFVNKTAARDLPSTPEGTATTIAQSLADGHPEIIWSALPAKYQADVKGLLADYATKMDKDVYEKTFAITNKLVKVLKDKKDFILGLPMLQAGPVAAKKEEISKSWPSLVGLLETLAQSDINTLDGLKNLDVEKFLANTGGKLVTQLKELAALMPEGEDKTKAMAKLDNMKNLKVTVTKTESADTVVLKLEVPGEPVKEVPFKQVDGKWLPAQLVDNWDQSVAKAKETISKMDVSQAKMQIMGMMGMVDGVLDQLDKANTQEEFTMTVMQLAAMFGGGPPRGGPPGAGGPPQ